MITTREEILAEKVNVHIAQLRRADRWWWLAGWRAWLRGALEGCVTTMVPLGIYFWLVSSRNLESSSTVVTPFVIALVVATAITAGAAQRRSREQQEKIARLEERIRKLEESRDS